MENSPTFLYLPIVIIVALITGFFSVAATLLAQFFLFPKTKAEAINQLADAAKKDVEIQKITLESETIEIGLEEKRNLLSNTQISTLLKTAMDQSTQIDSLLRESSQQKVEIDRLVTIVGYNENEKSELNAVIKYQQGEIQRLQADWAQAIVKINESRARESALQDKLEITIRQVVKFERLLIEAGIPVETGKLKPIQMPENDFPTTEKTDKFTTKSEEIK